MMMIREVIARTGLTRKAIEYYIDQGLICPETQENGYREFSGNDVARLTSIAVYRKLGVSIPEIKAILSDSSTATLKKLAARRSLIQIQEKQKVLLLTRLSEGHPIDEIVQDVEALETKKDILERLTDAFPGYFGQYLSVHFSGFLLSPIESREQMDAYETIVHWLDTLPPLDLPDDLRAFLDEAAADLQPAQMEDMHAAVFAAGENPEAYLKAHEDTIRAYLQIRETQEYKSSPAARMMEIMKDFQQQNGYTDVFLPAMERLSPAYAAYRRRLKEADEVFSTIFGDKRE